MYNEDDPVNDFQQEISLDTAFNLPREFSEHTAVLGKHLIVAATHANWLVCDDEEYRAFLLLKAGRTVREAIADLIGQGFLEPEAIAVVSRTLAQIMGKDFREDAPLRERTFFRSANLNLTAGCNLRCVTCLRNATVALPNECSLDDWKRFLIAFKNGGAEYVINTGGEPMLNPDHVEIIRFEKSLGLQVVMLTNGTLVNVVNAGALCRYCDEIQVSIDGPDRASHEKTRGVGTFDQVLIGLRCLAKFTNCKLSVAMTPTPDTLPAFKSSLGGFLRRLQKEVRPDITLRVSTRLLEGRAVTCRTPEQNEDYYAQVIALCDEQIEPGFIDRLSAVSVVPNQRVTSCGVAETFNVMADGSIRICQYSPEVFGNIKGIGKTDGADFIQGVKAKLRALIDGVSVEKAHPCSNCELRYICGGTCRRENERDRGDPLVSGCSVRYKTMWLERLVRINPYIVVPVESAEGR